MNSALIYPVNQSGPEILKLADVRVRFPVSNDWLGRPRGYAHALNGIDLQVRAGETLGIVGESGCGKSTLAQLLMGLLKPSSGELSWANGSKGEGSSNVQIVFQDPQSSLNPRLLQFGQQVEDLCLHRDIQRRGRFVEDDDVRVR